MWCSGLLPDGLYNEWLKARRDDYKKNTHYPDSSGPSYRDGWEAAKGDISNKQFGDFMETIFADQIDEALRKGKK